MAKSRWTQQRRLVKLISENVGLAKPKTVVEMMLEAGYEEGVFIGVDLTVLGALMLPARTTWRGITLIVWALIALTSPLFGSCSSRPGVC